MKTVAKVMWIHEADMIKAKLAQHDIEAFIPDEGMSSIMPIFGNTIGGVRIQVHENDLERAREIIEENRKEVSNCGETCPSCHSDDVVYLRLSSRAFFGSMLLLGFPFLFMKNKYTCQACGYKWAADQSKSE